MAYDIGTARGVIEMTYNGRGVKQAIGDLDAVEDRGSKSQAVMGKLGSAIGGLAIAATFAAGIKTVADFEKQISAIGAVSGASGDELDSLREKALQLGAETAFSATEAAGAIEELVKAGLSVDEVLNGAADAAVNLAAAGGIGIPEAATLAANAMNQFNLTAAELPGVVDAIAGAANASAIDVSDLGTSLTQVGAVANLAGMEFEDVATAIALMGNAGIVGSDAGTSLKTMLQNLQPTTKKQIELFEELNLLTEDGTNKFFDAEGNVKSYADVAGVLANALKGQTNQQKLLNLETLFGSDAIRAAAVAADAGREGVNALNEEMGKTTAAEVAAKRMDNFAGSVDQLMGSLETAVIAGGSGVLVLLRDVVDIMTEAVNKGVELGGALAGQVAPGFESLYNAISNVINFAIDFIKQFEGIIEVVGSLSLGIVIATFNAVADVLEFVTGLLEGQEAVLAFVLGAWLLLANGGIVAVASKLGWLAAGALVKGLDGLVALDEGARNTSGSLKALAATAASTATSLGAVAILVAAVGAWNAYKEAVQETEDALNGVAEAKEAGTASALSDELESISELIEKRVKEINDAEIDNPFDALMDVQITNWDDLGKIHEYEGSLDSLVDTANEVRDTLLGMGSGVTGLAGSLGLIEPAEISQIMTDLESADPSAIERIDGLIAEMNPLLTRAGISAEEFTSALQGTGDLSMAEVQSAIEGVTGKAKGAAGATISLTEAAKDFGNEALSAADKAKALDEALQNLIGVELSADQAAIAWREGLRTLRAEIDRTAGALFNQTKVGDANRSLVIASTQDILARVTAEAKAGTSIGKITRMFSASRQELIRNVATTKAQRREMNALLDSYNFTPEAVRTLIQAVGVERARNLADKLIAKYKLTPDVVETIFEAAGAETAKEQVRALREHIADLPKDKKPKVETPGAEEAADQVQTLEEMIHDLKSKDAKIATPGAVEAEQQVNELRQEVALLQSKMITITYHGVVTGNHNPGGGGGGGGGNGDGVAYIPRGGDDPTPRLLAGMLGTSTGTPSQPAVGVLSSPRTGPGKRSAGRSRIVEGELRLHPDGRAFISGLASDEDSAHDDYADTIERMRR